MSFPVFDLHCDTAFAMLNDQLEPTAELNHNDLHFDLLRASRYPAYTQCFACFSSPLLNVDPKRLFSAEVDYIQQQIKYNESSVAFAGTAAQIRNNVDNGCVSAILTIEGPAGFDYDPGQLEYLHKLGFRITTLGWNEANPLTGSHLTGKGLSDLGKAYVMEAQRLGMIVDVSHISDEGFYDIMQITQAPIIATHSNSRTVCPHSRNLTDEMFGLICETGGVAGINLFTDFVGSTRDLNGVCDHIMHFLEIDSDGKHIALGGDLDGCDRLPVGMKGVESYNNLAETLLQRGVDSQTISRIFWSNSLGVMERCCT